MRRTVYQLSLACALLGSACGAETVLDGAAFEALAQGKVLRFTQEGRTYGAEQFFAGRQSTWQYADGTCVNGIWYEGDGTLCFDYEDAFPAQCWIFAKRDGDYFARLAGAPSTAPGQLRLSGIDEGPLECPGPDLGV